MINKFVKYIGIFLLSLLILMVLGFSYLYIENKVYESRYEEAQFCYHSAFGSTMGTKCICDGTLLHSKCPTGYSCDSGVVKCDGEIVGFVYVYFDEEFETLEEFEMYCNELDEGRNKELCLAEVEIFRDDN